MAEAKPSTLSMTVNSLESSTLPELVASWEAPPTRCHGHPEEARENRSDSLEDSLVILFSLQLPTVVGLAIFGLTVVQSRSRA